MAIGYTLYEFLCGLGMCPERQQCRDFPRVGRLLSVRIDRRIGRQRTILTGKLLHSRVTCIERIGTEDQLANIFTKPLDENRFCKLRNELNILDFSNMS
jgi:hypothetical protein